MMLCVPSRLDLNLQLLRHALDIAKGAYPARWTPPVPSEARWSRERALAWEREVGWLVGCNFMPSTSGNQLEMFQAETYDPATIDRELGWAADLGMNSIRLFLHHLLPEVPGFWERLDEVLDLAAAHGIGAMLVLFDGCWNPVSRLGPQPEPRPRTHNSNWLQSPGSEILSDPRRWPELRPYVDAVLERYGADPRVHCWDVFNEPNGPEVNYIRSGTAGKYRLATELLDQVFDWCQEADPSQPLTAGAFVGISGALERGDRINRIMLSRSDVITFHSYLPRARLLASIEHLVAYGRPVLCTEWMGRPRSTPDLIEVFADHQVGCYTWGLVDGRTQTKYPWTSWQRATPPDAPWFHELLHADGRPYDAGEVEHFARTVQAARAASPS
jgi:hypothetical protein